MKVQGWHVDGFGHFRDYAVADIPPGLTVFLGPNEAGKTTLVAFITAMLFGFPDGRTRERRYEALMGGRLGGRLHVTDDRGDAYTLDRSVGQRSAVRVTLPNGDPGSEEDLRTLLGGCDRKLFRSVFAFSLSELQSFDSLDESGIRDRIFSAGIVGAGRSARSAVEVLQNRQDLLLKSRGAARINDLAAELADRDDRIRTARAEAAAYANTCRAERARAAEVAALDDDLARARGLKGRYELLTALWPKARERAEAASQLAHLPAVDAFPVDAHERLSRALDAVSAAEAAFVPLDHELQDAKQQHDALQVDDALAEAEVEAAALYRELELYQERLARLPEAQGRQARSTRDLERLLHDLGPTWDRARLAAFDRSIPRSEDVRAHETGLAQAARAAGDAEAELKRARAAREAARRDRDKAAAALAALSEPRAPEVLADLERAVRRLRANLADIAAAELRVKAAESKVDELARMEEAAQASVPWAPPGGAGLGLAALAVAALAGGIWQLTGSGSTPLAIIGFAAAIVLVLLAVAARKRARTVDASRARVAAQFAEQRRQAEDHLAEQRRETQAIAASIATDAGALQLPPRPTALEVEDASGVVAQEDATRADYERRRADLADADERLNALTAAEGKANAAADDASATEREAQDTWAAWKRDAGVPDQLSPQGVLDFFEAVRVARDALSETQRADEDLTPLRDAVAQYEERVRALARGLDEPVPPGGQATLDAVEELFDRVRRDQDARVQRDALAAQIRELAVKVESAQRLRRAQEQQRDALYAEAGVEDEAAFRERLQFFQQRTALRATVDECDRQIAERIGDGYRAESMSAELATGDVLAWQGRAVEAEELIAELQVRRDDALRAGRDAERERQRLEESTDLMALQDERAFLATDLAGAVHEWRVATLAQALIEHTLSRFEQERQPEVLAHASRHFAQVTRGEYVRLQQRDDVMTIADRQGRARHPQHLSRGTAEQLYLCLRLGLGAEFARRDRALPLIMDDILVNFDPERSRAVAEVLCEFAGAHQVLLFTCHPETAQLLAELNPDGGSYELARYAGRSNEYHATANGHSSLDTDIVLAES